MPVTNFGPTIRLTFKGLFLSFVQDGADFAQIGSVLGSPCHRPRLSVQKNRAIVDLPDLELEEDTFVKNDIKLEVTHTSQSKIAVFSQPGFNRVADAGNEKDFQWQIDLQKDIFAGKSFNLRKDQIGPIFQTNSGVFFTSKKTPGILKIKRSEDDVFQTVGRGAQVISADIQFDQILSRAVLSCDGKELLTIDACDVVKGNSYEITFDCECPRIPLEAGENPEVDFPQVFNALQVEGDQPVFEGELPEAIPADPQVFCTGGGTGGQLKP